MSRLDDLARLMLAVLNDEHLFRPTR